MFVKWGQLDVIFYQTSILLLLSIEVFGLYFPSICLVLIVLVLESVMVTNRGERVMAVPRRTLDGFSAAGCGYNCSLTSWCRTFVIRRLLDGVNYQTCFLFDKTRSQLQRDGQLSFGDDTSALYEPLSSTARNPDDQGCIILTLHNICMQEVEQNDSRR